VKKKEPGKETSKSRTEIDEMPNCQGGLKGKWSKAKSIPPQGRTKKELRQREAVVCGRQIGGYLRSIEKLAPSQVVRSPEMEERRAVEGEERKKGEGRGGGAAILAGRTRKGRKFVKTLGMEGQEKKKGG